MNRLKLSEFDFKVISEIYRKHNYQLGMLDMLFASPYSLLDSQGNVKQRISPWLNEVRKYLLNHFDSDKTAKIIIHTQAEIITKGTFRLIPNLVSESNKNISSKNPCKKAV